MGKLLSLGKGLKYPIKVSRLLVESGSTVAKQEAILEYSFQWDKLVGDPFGDEWKEKQTTYATFDSPSDGAIESWLVKAGETIEADKNVVEVEESCSHEVQFAGMCAICGKDMTETNWASTTKDSERAKINMIHDQNLLKISDSEASKAEEELQRKLLKQRKLSLVVDLDQTIIHACVEPTIGQWQRDPTSPNHQAVKDVKAFQLNDPVPRGATNDCWYYIKMRPGLKEFLDKISEIYELHVYTMGTRAYATNIARIVDPDKKLFGDRIISRDENGSITAKSLARLFPVDTRMVVIIDDRADVWPKNRPNLIKVHPYDFFVGIGDINSSFLPKREELPSIKVAELMGKVTLETQAAATSGPETTEILTGEAPVPESAPKSTATGAENTEETKSDDGSKISALEELVRMGGGNDQALRNEQTDEQKKSLEKQLIERPLLHMQEKLDSEENEAEVGLDEKNGNSTVEHHHRHNLLKDDDVELMYLEKHLSAVHKAFYDEYDGALLKAQGGRVAQLKPGINKKLSVKKDATDLTIVPDIGHVMPSLKAKVLQGTTVVLSGIVPLNAEFLRYLNSDICEQSDHDMDLRDYTYFKEVEADLPRYRTEIALQALSFGAFLDTKISRRVTHLVTPTSRTRTHKVRQAARYPDIKIVNQQWLLDSMSKWEKQDESRYLVDIPDRLAPKGPNSHSSLEDTIDSDDEASSSELDDEGSNPSSQREVIDEEGVMPPEVDGLSPIDDLKTFDWGGADDELAEFMGSDDDDSENDSDASSVTSDKSGVSSRGTKRVRDDTEDEDSDEGSSLAKKQRLAKERTTGLKTVKTPNSAGSESSLPTPGVTGDEDGDEGDETLADEEDDGEWKDLEDDLEAELEAELAAA